MNAGGVTDTDAALAWRDCVTALELALLAPERLGGVVLHGRHGPVRDALLARLADRCSLERLAAGGADHALDASLDIAATLGDGRAVRRAGLLERMTGDMALLVVGIERLSLHASDRLCRWLDDGAGHAIVALDESEHDADGDMDPIGSALGDRLALHVRLPDLSLADLAALQLDDHERVHAGAAMRGMTTPDSLVVDLTRLADALGIVSARAPVAALVAARAIAARDGRRDVAPDDAALAARLVLAPRARRLPTTELDNDAVDESSAPDAAGDSAADTAPDTPSERATPDADERPASVQSDPEAGTAVDATPLPDAPLSNTDEVQALPDRLVEAVASALPPNLLGSLASGFSRGGGPQARAGGGATRATRGRPVGVARPRGGDDGRRLDLVATLKAAAPWQRIRRAPTGARLAVRPSDFRVRRYVKPQRTTTVFIVDASGSAAMHRIGEAKGALEAVLAECYVRRDRVALISFRGSAATLELPPTRSLARARRALVGLPAGGGTPIAAGLDLAASVLGDIVRGGERAVGILMTDGRANVTRAGIGGRHEAQSDAEDAAARLAALDARLLYVDTATRPRPVSQRLASAMNARYLPLPSDAGRALPGLLADGARVRANEKDAA